MGSYSLGRLTEDCFSKRSARSEKLILCPTQSELAFAKQRLATEGDWLRNRFLPKASLRPGVVLASLASTDAGESLTVNATKELTPDLLNLFLLTRS